MGFPGESEMRVDGTPRGRGSIWLFEVVPNFSHSLRRSWAEVWEIGNIRSIPATSRRYPGKRRTVAVGVSSGWLSGIAS